MLAEKEVQQKFERDRRWERSWPKCFIAVIGTIQILLSLLILVTEVFNILADIWYTNVFGGIWCFIILFTNWILIFMTVCCNTTVRTSTFSFVWNFITLCALTTLIVFDIIFILNPYTCILTSICSSQTSLTQINFITSAVSSFRNYTIYDSKKLYLQIQVGCAGVAFILSLIYIIVFLICRLKLRQRTLIDNPSAAVIPPTQGLRIARAPTVPYGNPITVPSSYTPHQ